MLVPFPTIPFKTHPPAYPSTGFGKRAGSLRRGVQLAAQSSLGARWGKGRQNLTLALQPEFVVMCPEGRALVTQ